ncbi:MAG: rod shape-determining protein MreC [Desulfobacterales bacterium]|nr:rod shape-determining protein MreC [Desulfobacterales bacterium]
MVVCGIILIAVNIIILSVTSKNRNSSNSTGRIGITLVAPFQEVAAHLLRFAEDIWNQYFFLVSVAEENADLKRALSRAIEKNNQCKEISLSNIRLRKLLNFQKKIANKFLSAEVIGKDPSPWFKSIIIDKGQYDGVKKGLPVVIPEGIAGQVIDVSAHYSKVLLIIDQNSAVDVMIQRTRARGIIKGESKGQCLLKYVLRKHDIRVGDVVVSSGLDGVFPKGLRVGYVSGVIRRNAGIFQEVTVNPYIDFEKLEEVLVILNPPKHVFVSKQ